MAWWQFMPWAELLGSLLFMLAIMGIYWLIICGVYRMSKWLLILGGRRVLTWAVRELGWQRVEHNGETCWAPPVVLGSRIPETVDDEKPVL